MKKENDRITFPLSVYISLIQGVSKKRGPFLKMLLLPDLRTKLFKIFCACRKLIPLCSKYVLLSGGAAYRK